MPQEYLFLSFSPILLSAPNSLFLQLLSACYATVMLLGMFVFSSSLFAAIILLLETPSYFISWNIQVSRMFLYITRICRSTETVLWLELNCKITTGRLGKQNVPRTRSRKRQFQQFFPVLLVQVLETQLLVRVTLIASLGFLSSPIIKFATTLEHIIYLCRKFV